MRKRAIDPQETRATMRLSVTELSAIITEESLLMRRLHRFSIIRPGTNEDLNYTCNYSSGNYY